MVARTEDADDSINAKRKTLVRKYIKGDSETNAFILDIILGIIKDDDSQIERSIKNMEHYAKTNVDKMCSSKDNWIRKIIKEFKGKKAKSYSKDGLDDK